MTAIKHTDQVCKYCGKIYHRKKIQPYCSIECYAKGNTKMRPCPICGKQFPSYPKTVYCSKKCLDIAISKREKRTMSQEQRNKISEARKKSPKCKGENLYNWKGGKETEKIRFRMHNRARFSKLKKKIDPYFIKSLLIAQRRRCFYCEADIKEYYEIEHLTAVKYGGDNQEYNIVLSCRRCNSKKRTKSMETFAIIEGKNWPDKWEHVYTSALIIKDKLKNGKNRIQEVKRT